MKTKYKLTIAAAVISAAIPTLSSAHDYSNSIVLDARGNAVTTKDGKCVTHDFPQATNNECLGKTVSLSDRSISELSIPNVVYFGFDKSGLDSRGSEVVSAIAEGLNTLGGSYNVTLSGHADTVASGSYNEALSAKRASAVKAALIAEGVNASSITTKALGESSNAVPTGNNVPEALNRRVEISVSR